jgi:hypothetical protein
MKPTAIKFIVLAILSMAFTACFETFHKPGVGTYVAIGVDSEDQEIDLVAGTKKARTINQSRSVEHGMRTFNTLGTTAIFGNVTKSVEAGKRVVESDGINAATEQARIDSTTTLGIEKEKTARMMIEPPPVVPVAPPATP